MQPLVKLALIVALAGLACRLNQAHQHQHQNQQQAVISFARRQTIVQLKCEAQGEEPITIEWFKNKQRLNVNELDPRYSIHYKAARNELKSQLVIKNLQRSDTNSYECLAKNKAGKAFKTHELYVQEEPDAIQDLQATQISSRAATLVWTEPFNGRSAITGYEFQYKRVHEPSVSFELDAAAAASSSPSPSLVPQAHQQQQQQQQLDDQVRPGASHGLSLGATSLAGQPANVGVSASVSMSTVGTDLDDWQTAARLDLPVRPALAAAATAHAHNQTSPTPGGRSISIEQLEPFTKYVIRAQAKNLVGTSKFSQPIEFTTDEEAPELAPTKIRADAINSTSIQVSWDEIPKSRQLAGRIQGYYIGYRLANQSSGHSFLYKPYIVNELLAAAAAQPGNQLLLQAQSQQHQEQRLEITLAELRRDTAYEISVVAFNSRGSGPSSDFVVCKTNELEPPMPVKIQIRRESNESIFIEWQRDPLDSMPVDDFVLYQEKNSASQEWLQLRLPGNQSQYKAPGLKCGTRYQFYIIAQNRMGKSEPSDVVSTSTSGSKPAVPSKASLIRMVNSTCLQINLNSFQDSVCRIRTFTVRYRLEKLSPSTLVSSASGLAAAHQALTAGQPASGGPLGPAGSGSNGSGGASAAGGASASSSANKQQSDEWITVRPRQPNAAASGAMRQLPFYHQLHSASRQAGEQEDRMEYLCHLNPLAEYTIHVAAQNDVGRTEVAYSVLMSSDELRQSSLRELADLLTSVASALAYMPSVSVFMLAGLLLTLVCMLLFTGAAKYYQKFVIMHNQIRATRRAKRDERRRRKLNNLQHSQKLDLWTAEFEQDDGRDDDDDDDDDGQDLDDDDRDQDDDDGAAGLALGRHERPDCDRLSSNSASSSQAGFAAPNPARLARRQRAYLRASEGHFLSNIASSVFDTSSPDTSGCGLKYTGSSCSRSTASTESIHQRFQCLNSKQYVKMNEYTVLPSISASLSPPGESIYGQASVVGPAQQQQQQQANANNIYYSTLRRSSMQTYLPHQQQQPQPQQQQQQQHRSTSGCVRCCATTLAPETTTQQLLRQQHTQNINNRDNADIYGPPASHMSQYGKLGIYIV